MLVLVTGGAASGKSQWAEEISCFLNKGKMAYWATMNPEADEETLQRIEKHKKMRAGKGFETLEIPYDLKEQGGKLALYDTVLLECLSNLIANEMFLAGRKGLEAVKVATSFIKKLSSEVSNLIVVSTVLLGGFASYDEFTEEYIEALNLANTELATGADVVLEIVCSIPIIHKGKEKIDENLSPLFFNSFFNVFETSYAPNTLG